MVNMAVQYRGPDPALITLTNELRAHYGNPARTYEFVTGYKSPANYSGHNPDSDGIVHAVDIFTDDQGNIPEAEGRALAERLRLTGKATGRFSYLIHDMSAGAPQPMIAGQHTNWLWAAYGGADAHSDHIHLSIADGYWGDPCNVPATMYNDTSRWGITSGTTAQAGDITPILEEGFLMALSHEEQVEALGLLRKIEQRTTRYLDDKVSVIPKKTVEFEFPKQGNNEKGEKFTELPIPAKTSIKTELGWQDAGNISIRNKIEQVKK